MIYDLYGHMQKPLSLRYAPRFMSSHQIVCIYIYTPVHPRNTAQLMMSTNFWASMESLFFFSFLNPPTAGDLTRFDPLKFYTPVHPRYTH